ncbi:unnamed protein product [Ectocarpus sp. 12 AP-2014]
MSTHTYARTKRRRQKDLVEKTKNDACCPHADVSTCEPTNVLDPSRSVNALLSLSLYELFAFSAAWCSYARTRTNMPARVSLATTRIAFVVAANPFASARVERLEFLNIFSRAFVRTDTLLKNYQVDHDLPFSRTYLRLHSRLVVTAAQPASATRHSSNCDILSKPFLAPHLHPNPGDTAAATPHDHPCARPITQRKQLLQSTINAQPLSQTLYMYTHIPRDENNVQDSSNRCPFFFFLWTRAAPPAIFNASPLSQHRNVSDCMPQL